MDACGWRNRRFTLNVIAPWKARNTSYSLSHFNPMYDGDSRVSSQFCHDLIHYKKVLTTERIKEIHEMNHFHTCGSKCVFQRRSDQLLLSLQLAVQRSLFSFAIRCY